MARLIADNLDPAEMHLSPVEVAELLSQLPADHPLVAAARVGVELAAERHATAVDHAESATAVREAVRERGGDPRPSGRYRAAAADDDRDCGYTRSETTETCLRWAHEYQEQREADDDSRRRFADSPVDYGDDDDDGYGGSWSDEDDGAAAAVA